MDLGFEGGFVFGGRCYKRLSFEVVWANDLDELACKTYAVNLPHEIRCGDIVGLMETLPEAADLVIGGFPCQDVSINGRLSVGNGVRTVLYRNMIDVIKRVKPKAFVAENVKGLLMSHGRAFFDQMLADFDLPDYSVCHKLYLAADYGVPQMRERVFIVGIRGDDGFVHPEPLGRRMTAREALHDLDGQLEDRGISDVWSKARRSPDQGNRKLKPDQPSTTIRAEHHGNIQWHYGLNCRISLREAARLQSFPDEFNFPCAMRPTERQIGNVVPPVLAWHIANALGKQLDASSGCY